MQKNYPKITYKSQSINFSKFTIGILCSIYFCNAYTQNSMVGDGFGGRLWYKPYNYSTGAYSAYTICGDSSQLYGWGDNQFGQLGIGHTRNSITPMEVKGMNHVRYFSTGYVMGVIRNDRTAWVWGNLISNKPIKVLENVKFLDAGYNASTFVKFDGTVWTVGQNTYGSFGNGKTNLASTQYPVKMEVIQTAVRVANGYYNNSILLSNGKVATVGTNFEGCLGTNTPENEESLYPIIIGGLQDIIDIKSTYGTTIALDKFGNVYAWGDGRKGCIGNGNFISSSVPQKIFSLENIVAISGCNDGEHFLALDANHNCYGWGCNQYGQLGTGNIENKCTPQLIAVDVDDIMAGELFTYIIKTDGSLWATGRSLSSSIWMNLTDVQRTSFTKLSPQRPPMNICVTNKYRPKIYNSVHMNICHGKSTLVRNVLINPKSMLIDTFKTYDGVDSIVTTYTHIIPPSLSNQKITLCTGEKYSIGQHQYSVSGIYMDTLSNYLGCDSIVTTNLLIKPKSFSHKTFTINCGDELITSRGSYSTSCQFNDTFSNYSGCDSIVFNTLNVISRATLTQTHTICYGESVRIGKHKYSFSGSYLDTLLTMQGCDSVISTTLIVNSNPVADFTYPKTTIFTDDSFMLTNTSVLANRYVWRYGPTLKDTSTVTHPIFMYKTDGMKNIQLTAINTYTGCTDSIQKPIEIIDNTNVLIPNAFTPNNDQINDRFYPIIRNYDGLKMQIFNRWGELIFETNQWNTGWDGTFEGKNCTQDVYCYKIELTNSNPVKSKTFSGTLTLIR